MIETFEIAFKILFFVFAVPATLFACFFVVYVLTVIIKDAIDAKRFRS